MDLAVVSASLSIIVASIAIWKANSSVIKRLVLIQKRLDSLKGISIALQSRTNDIEKYLSVNHGYQIRGASSAIEKAFLSEYDDNETGF
jgi:hypothetical protein